MRQPPRFDTSDHIVPSFFLLLDRSYFENRSFFSHVTVPARTRIRLIEKRTCSARAFVFLLLFEDLRPHTSRSLPSFVMRNCVYCAIRYGLTKSAKSRFLIVNALSGYRSEKLLSRQRFNAIVRLTISDSATT